MAVAACSYHPDQISSTACSQCGRPLCSGCVETVANQPVCRNCVGAIRARVAAQMNAAQMNAAQMNAAPPPGAAPAMPANPFMPQAQAVRPAPPTSATGLLLGVVYGTVAGAVGAFLLAKIEGATGFEWGYLNALVGFGVGYGVLMGDRRGGVPAAVAGGVLAFFAMMFCEYLLLSDAVAKYAGAHGLGAVSVNSAMFLDYLRHRDIIDWVCIAIGVYGGAKTPLRARR